LTFTNARLRRDEESARSERATSSLPVPLSPRISTVASVSATRAISSRTFTIEWLWPSSSTVGGSFNAWAPSCGARVNSSIACFPPRTASDTAAVSLAPQQGRCHEWKTFRRKWQLLSIQDSAHFSASRAVRGIAIERVRTTCRAIESCTD
jgi:hypothetical protein